MPDNLSPLIAFAAVCALIPLALWLLKRSPLGGVAQGGGLLKAVGTLQVSASQRVLVVEVGTGAARQWLVLGVSPGQIQALHTLPAGDGQGTADAR